MSMGNRAFGEIIESSLDMWTAQSWKWDQFPNAGSLVVAEMSTEKVFGVITRLETGSIDPNRTPFAYQKTEEELLREQPHIFSYLMTRCFCIAVGFQPKGVDTSIVYHQVPRPPKIHTFIRPAEDEEKKIFFNTHEYLYLLFKALPRELCDEILLAIIREEGENFDKKEQKYLDFFKTYAHLINHEYARLRRFTSRAEVFFSQRV